MVLLRSASHHSSSSHRSRLKPSLLATSHLQLPRELCPKSTRTSEIASSWILSWALRRCFVHILPLPPDSCISTSDVDCKGNYVLQRNHQRKIRAQGCTSLRHSIIIYDPPTTSLCNLCCSDCLSCPTMSLAGLD